MQEVPQTYRHPYVFYGTCNRLLRVPLGICYLAAWGHASYHYPKFTLTYLAYCIWKQYSGYKKFFNAYPYMLTARNVLAAIACDYSWLLIGLWGLCTISTDAWVHGDGNGARKQPGIAVLKPQHGPNPTEKAPEIHEDSLVDMPQTTSADVLGAPGRISAPDQESVLISARRPDAEGNLNDVEPGIPTYQEALIILDSLLQAKETQRCTGALFPYKAPVTIVSAGKDEGLRPVTAMIPCEEWSEGCISNEDTNVALEVHEEDEHEKEE